MSSSISSGLKDYTLDPSATVTPTHTHTHKVRPLKYTKLHIILKVYIRLYYFRINKYSYTRERERACTHQHTYMHVSIGKIKLSNRYLLAVRFLYTINVSPHNHVA